MQSSSAQLSRLWPLLGLAISAMSGLSAAAPSPQQVYSTFSQKGLWASGTVVSFPRTNQAAFDNATIRYTTVGQPTYAAAISPATENDVVTAVRLATQINVPFLATGGRHSFTTTLVELHNGLAIDLSKLNTVELNAAEQTVTLGGGVRLSAIYDPLFNSGFMMPIGSCSCPGVIGVTLGSGVGRFQGVYGLLADNLVSVRMVTAGGELIEVSATSHPDLFWGIRGAGANLGVVVSATFKVHPLINEGQILLADLVIPAELASSYFKVLESFSGTMPAKLASVSLMRYNTDADAPDVLANWAYLGPEAEGREVMADILALNAPASSVRMVPWNKLVASSGFGGFDGELCKPGVPRDTWSQNLRNLSAPTFDLAFEKMSTLFADHPSTRDATLMIEAFPIQAMAAVPQNETAYPWRDSVGYIATVFTLDDDAATNQVQRDLGYELRSDFVETSGYPDLVCYVNYAHGDETLEQIYGKEKLPYLANLKRTWDPKNVFAFNNHLPQRYP